MHFVLQKIRFGLGVGVNSPSCNAPMVGTNPTLASGGMARLADRMAAMVRETAMPTLAADGIFAAAAALISIYYLMQWFQCMYLSPAPSSCSAEVEVAVPPRYWTTERPSPLEALELSSQSADHHYTRQKYRYM